jgi:hypothetical protein
MHQVPIDEMNFMHNWSGALSRMKCLLLICTTAVTCAAMAKEKPGPVATLHAKYASLEQRLRQNQFKRPLVLDSAETANRLKGDVYAIVDYPFDAVSSGLNNPDHWCDVMLLHMNTKYCHAVANPSGISLKVNIGKKTPEELADAVRLEFHYKVSAVNPEYFEIMLNAKDGPMGTSDYRILLEAVALPNAKTFLHLSYSYAINFAGKLAMQTYLGTIGSDKVGFTVIGKRDDGQPDYIGGVRGMMERNTMRYYLAIDTFLGAASTVAAAQLEKRLQSWFTAAEHYPRQLHEMDRSEYLEMKRAEYVRQQSVN